jgi:hypothetical protein
MDAGLTVNRRPGSIRAIVNPRRPKKSRWWRPRLQTILEDEILKIIPKKRMKP